jgi:hypothetical protein
MANPEDWLQCSLIFYLRVMEATVYNWSLKGREAPGRTAYFFKDNVHRRLTNAPKYQAQGETRSCLVRYTHAHRYAKETDMIRLTSAVK